MKDKVTEVAEERKRKMEDKIRVLISEEEIAKRLKEIADQMNQEYAGKSVHLICVLKGSVFVTTELAKYLTVPVTLDFMSVSSYGDGTESSGRVKIVKDVDESIEGRHVVVIEDIIDSGRTLSFLMDMMKNRKPASLKLCALLDKPDRRVTEVEVDYVGFTIPDEFVVGFGLDYAQKYRNLPYVGVIEV